jgi:hypothetical protein
MIEIEFKNLNQQDLAIQNKVSRIFGLPVTEIWTITHTSYSSLKWIQKKIQSKLIHKSGEIELYVTGDTEWCFKGNNTEWTIFIKSRDYSFWHTLK